MKKNVNKCTSCFERKCRMFGLSWLRRELFGGYHIYFYY